MFFEFKALLPPLLTSLGFVVIWVAFFFIFFPKSVTKITVFISFCLGIISAGVALFIEKIIFYSFKINTDFLNSGFQPEKIFDLIGPLLFSFVFIALAEEGVKFAILRGFINSGDQIVDFMGIGLWIGLGFAFIENTIYFFSFYSQGIENVWGLTILRGVISTLAHCLYGVVMGYYVGLGKFYKLYRSRFFQTGFFASFLLHGFFNFFLIMNLSIYSVSLLVFALILVLIWSGQRKNLEVHYVQKGLDIKSLPFLSSRRELEAFLASKNASVKSFSDVMNKYPQ